MFSLSLMFFPLTAKAGVAFRHVSLVLSDVNGVTPIRHVIAFTRKNISRLDSHAGNGSGVFVPAITTMNSQGLAPSIINLIPFYVSKSGVITLFNQRPVRICFESLPRFGLTLFKGNTPNTIGGIGAAPCREFLEIISRRLFGPYRFCIIQIKEIFRFDNLGSGCGNARYLQEDK